MNANIIETDNLTKVTGSQMRVNHIDLHIPEGRVYGFLVYIITIWGYGYKWNDVQ